MVMTAISDPLVPGAIKVYIGIDLLSASWWGRLAEVCKRYQQRAMVDLMPMYKLRAEEQERGVPC